MARSGVIVGVAEEVHQLVAAVEASVAVAVAERKLLFPGRTSMPILTAT
jgi:hypothetical protein